MPPVAAATATATAAAEAPLKASSRLNGDVALLAVADGVWLTELLARLFFREIPAEVAELVKLSVRSNIDPLLGGNAKEGSLVAGADLLLPIWPE